MSDQSGIDETALGASEKPNPAPAQGPEEQPAAAPPALRSAEKPIPAQVLDSAEQRIPAQAFDPAKQPVPTPTSALQMAAAGRRGGPVAVTETTVPADTAPEGTQPSQKPPNNDNSWQNACAAAFDTTVFVATWLLMCPVLLWVPLQEALTRQGKDHDAGLPIDAPPCDEAVVAHIKAVYDGVWARRTHLDGKAQWLLALAGVLFSAMALFASRLAELTESNTAIIAHVATAFAGGSSLLAVIILLAYMREGDWNYPDYTLKIRRASTPKEHSRLVADEYLECVRENDRRLTFQSKLLSTARRYLFIAFVAAAIAAVASVRADTADTIWAQPIARYLWWILQ